jgi:hypothetical protein
MVEEVAPVPFSADESYFLTVTARSLKTRQIKIDCCDGEIDFNSIMAGRVPLPFNTVIIRMFYHILLASSRTLTAFIFVARTSTFEHTELRRLSGGQIGTGLSRVSLSTPDTITQQSLHLDSCAHTRPAY